MLEANFLSFGPTMATEISDFTVKIDFRNSTQSGRPVTDLALCRLKRMPVALTAARAKKQLIEATLTAEEADTPVYVVGFPDSADVGRAVHDGCTIVVPRWISGDWIGVVFSRLTLKGQLELCEKASDSFTRTVDRLRRR